MHSNITPPGRIALSRPTTKLPRNLDGKSQAACADKINRRNVQVRVPRYCPHSKSPRQNSDTYAKSAQRAQKPYIYAKSVYVRKSRITCAKSIYVRKICIHAQNLYTMCAKSVNVRKATSRIAQTVCRRFLPSKKQIKTSCHAMKNKSPQKMIVVVRKQER